jgi:hypothetical protein
MPKKRWLPWIMAFVLAVIITLYVMYSREHSLRLKEEAATRALVQQFRTLQEKSQMTDRSLEQITGHAQAVQAEGTFIDQRKYYRVNWKNYIHVSLNDYKTGLLGGVRDIKVTVSNQTAYPLDNVTVKLEYLKAKGKGFKTETIQISDIQPQASKSVQAPDSRRGMSLHLSLQRITSQGMNFCWEAGKSNLPDKQDPYQCVPLQNNTP